MSIDTMHQQSVMKRKKPSFSGLIVHLHPRNVHEKTLTFTLSWGLGGMSLVLILILAFTGILLLFVYQPFPDRAYDSILTINNEIIFGQFIRNIHHLSGNILVIIAFLHMMRIFFTGAFHGPRKLNWIIGIFLFFCVLISNFTGYLLPWDQLAFWAITIGTTMVEYIPFIGIKLQEIMRGGKEIGPQTLLIFFTLHSTVIPMLFVVIMPFHFWLIRKAGGLVISRSEHEKVNAKPQYVPTIPHLVVREFVVALVLIAFIMVSSIIVNAPLESQANPGMSPNPAKAPWYFLGIQELLLHFHPLFAVFIIPFTIGGALIIIPYLKYDSPQPGVWFYSQKAKKMGCRAAVIGLIITLTGIIADEFFIHFIAWMPGVPSVISTGLIPMMLVFGGIIGLMTIMKNKYDASKEETIQTLFILLLVSFIILTITGIWFRGQGMALTWPWNMK